MAQNRAREVVQPACPLSDLLPVFLPGHRVPFHNGGHASVDQVFFLHLRIARILGVVLHVLGHFQQRFSSVPFQKHSVGSANPKKRHSHCQGPNVARPSSTDCVFFLAPTKNANSMIRAFRFFFPFFQDHRRRSPFGVTRSSAEQGRLTTS